MKYSIAKILSENSDYDSLTIAIIEEAILTIYPNGMSYKNSIYLIHDYIRTLQQYDITQIKFQSLPSFSIGKRYKRLFLSIAIARVEASPSKGDNIKYLEIARRFKPSLHIDHQISFKPFFDGRLTINDIYLIPTRNQVKSNNGETIYSAWGCRLKNPVLRAVLKESPYANKIACFGHSTKDAAKNLEGIDKCLEEGELLSHRDLCDILFWTVVTRLKEQHPRNPLGYIGKWITVCQLIVESHKNYRFFRNNKYLTTGLLFNLKLTSFIKKGFTQIEKIYVYHDYKTLDGVNSAISLEISNPHTRRIIRQYLDYRLKTGKSSPIKSFINLFEQSLGDSAANIQSYKSFDNESVFWTQVLFFATRANKSDTKTVRRSIMRILEFYRILFELYPSHPFFEESTSLSQRVIQIQKPIAKVIAEGYTLIRYKEMMDAPPQEKIILIIKNLDEYSGRFLKDDFMIMDFSRIPDSYYRNLVKEYCFSSTKQVADFGSHHILIRVFSTVTFLIDSKTSHWRRTLYSDDGSRIRAITLETLQKTSPCSDFSIKHYLNTTYRFFRWAEENNVLSINNELFYKHFSWSLDSQETGFRQSITDETLSRLGDYLYGKSKSSVLNLLIFILFVLVIRIPGIRIGDLTDLERNCIRTTHKTNSFHLLTHTKNTRRFRTKKESFSIDKQTRDILLYAIDITSNYRKKKGQSPMSEYIFLYPSKIGIIHLPDNRFSIELKKACIELKLPPITPNKLRKTKMNLTWEYTQQTQGGTWVKKALTHHKDLTVTYQHYLDRTRERIIGQLFGFNIGEEYEVKDSQDKVIQTIPKEYIASRFDAEQQLGKCVSPSARCEGEAYLPCLLCRNFRTTPEFKKAFLAELEAIDSMIDKETDIQHDKDDLLTKRRLICNYLVAIMNFEKTTN